MSLAATSELSPAPVMAGWSLMSTASLQKSPLYIFFCSSQSVHFPDTPCPWLSPVASSQADAAQLGYPSKHPATNQGTKAPTHQHLLSSFPDISSTWLHVSSQESSGWCPCNHHGSSLLQLEEDVALGYGNADFLPMLPPSVQATASSSQHLYFLDDWTRWS